MNWWAILGLTLSGVGSGVFVLLLVDTWQTYGGALPSQQVALARGAFVWAGCAGLSVALCGFFITVASR